MQCNVIIKHAKMKSNQLHLTSLDDVIIFLDDIEDKKMSGSKRVKVGSKPP